MDTERICPGCQKPLPPDVPMGLCPECLIKAGFSTGTEPGGEGPGFVPPTVEQIAKLFPQLEIIELIGKGGMGAVYKARQPALDRFVALKILPPQGNGAPGFAERFNREARALARLVHPNIVVVHDFGQAGELPYLIMEFVDGANLREVERAGRITPEQALSIVPQICEALQFAHNEGVVHRDIKPENILLDKKGRVKIADFGIAKIMGVTGEKTSLTGAQDVIGTPHYMAPEQIERPTLVDHRADIFSLGVVFYEMLTGELPLGKFAPPSKKVQVDVRLDEVVLHALEKEPERRYQQAGQVKTDVENITSSRGGTPPPPFIPTLGTAGAMSEKTILPVFLLAFFFGIFGAHRFYAGKIWTGLLQLVSLGGCGIWVLIDWILILCKAFTDGQGKRITNWLPPNGSASKPNPEAIRGEMPNPPAAKATPLGDDKGLIVAPAVGLMVVAAWKLLSAVSGLFWFTSGSEWLTKFLPHGTLFGGWSVAAIFGIVLFKIIPGLLILYGGYEMLQRRNYAWAIAAGIVSIISCSLIGFPIGIWALIVLARDNVKSAFGSNSAVSLAPRTDRFWQRFALITACIILIPIGIALIGGLASVVILHAVPERDHAQEISAPTLPQAGISQDANGEFRKDSSQSFPFDAKGRFSLDQVSGRVEIHGWSNSTVVINSSIHGKTRASVEAVKINIDSKPDRVAVHTEQSSGGKGFPWSWLWFGKGNDASVDYVIQAPEHATLADISSVNGHLAIDGVAGDITASTVNGEMQIKGAARDLKLSTVNGQVAADMISLGNRQTVSFDAVNGEFELTVPEDSDAHFSVDTVNGDITSEFPPLKAKKEFPVGYNLNGELGKGSATVKVSAVNGVIKILKGHPAGQPPGHTLAEAPATNVLALPTDEKPQAVSNNIGVSAAEESPAASAAKSWLALIDAGNYSESWIGASAIFRGSVTEPSWENSMSTFRKPLGDAGPRKLTSAQPMTELPGAPDGQYLLMQFETSFANKKSAVETVTFVMEKDGQWKSAGYFIK
jgi:TM2 domain-containing membrane protein YozV/predicted Ser/Thr protein kinase